MLLAPAISKCPSYLKDSFDFVNIIKTNKDTPGLMCSLDVSSLYTNVPLEKAIDIAINKIKQHHPDTTIDDKNLKEYLTIARIKQTLCLTTNIMTKSMEYQWVVPLHLFLLNYI
jgi:hypothetical protein